METTDKLEFIFVIRVCLIITIVFIISVIDMNTTAKENPHITNTSSGIVPQETKGSLHKLLEKEIVNVNGWVCRDYVKYYNETLKKYNEGLIPPQRVLDIREIRMLDVCNGLTLCDSYHATLLVAGYGEYCILDQQEIKCVSFPTNEQTNNTKN